jgi:putative flippase GtrA
MLAGLEQVSAAFVTKASQPSLTGLVLGPSEWRVEVGRLLRYAFVGALTAVIYFSVTFAGVEWFGWPPVVASVLAQALTVAPAFYGHARYSFRLAPNREYFAKFLVITALLFAINFLLTWLITEHVGTSYRIAIIVVAIAIPLANFFLNRFWVFLPGLLGRTPQQSTAE